MQANIVSSYSNHLRNYGLANSLRKAATPEASHDAASGLRTFLVLRGRMVFGLGPAGGVTVRARAAGLWSPLRPGGTVEWRFEPARSSFFCMIPRTPAATTSSRGTFRGGTTSRIHSTMVASTRHFLLYPPP
eukprot:TRINITY_DN25140_c0_g1_i8.p1 TRINITY_DN25140_c0_g1~~TRINITY_DN25140_c0_g1_i8.p1  ORF type:complete len:132 (+),score=11.90 TRINITY_DN25140_c0_g1_i8:482-877(+)